MKLKLSRWKLSIVSLIFFLVPQISAGESLTAKEIFDRANKKTSVDYAFEKISLVLLDKNLKVEESRKYITYRKSAEGEKLYVQAYLEPKSMYGTATLSIQRKGEPDSTRWIYLPYINKAKMQRVSQTKSGSSAKILDTDYTHEDTKPINKEDFNYSTSEKDKDNSSENTKNIQNNKYTDKESDNTLYVIEVHPDNSQARKNSSYSKRIYYIDKKTFLIRQIDYYDTFGNLTKYQKFKSYNRVLGDRYLPKTVMMIAVRKNTRIPEHATTRIVESSVYSNTRPKNWSDSVFEIKNILNGTILTSTLE